MTTSRDEQFRAYVLASRGQLVRTATFLASGDRFAAEDLVQTALMRLYVAWPRVRTETVDAYARKSLLNALIDDRRRAFTRHERAHAEVPDVGSTTSHRPRPRPRSSPRSPRCRPGCAPPSCCGTWASSACPRLPTPSAAARARSRARPPAGCPSFAPRSPPTSCHPPACPPSSTHRLIFGTPTTPSALPTFEVRMSDITELFKQVAPSADARPPPRPSRPTWPAAGRLCSRDHRRRTIRRSMAATATVAAAAVVAVVVAQIGGGSGTAHPRNADPGPQTAEPSGAQPTVVKTHHKATSIKLVSYKGKQLAGFTVDKVPAGWFLSTSTQFALLIDPNGDKDNDPDAFVGKLAVLTQSSDVHHLPKGTAVTVNGQPGVVTDQGKYGLSLTYNDAGGFGVVIQAPAAAALVRPAARRASPRASTSPATRWQSRG